MYQTALVLICFLDLIWCPGVSVAAAQNILQAELEQLDDAAREKAMAAFREQRDAVRMSFPRSCSSLRWVEYSLGIAAA